MTFLRGGRPQCRRFSMQMSPAEAREEIAERIHNIMDVLREYPDEHIYELCDSILLYLDMLAEEEKRRGEDIGHTQCY